MLAMEPVEAQPEHDCSPVTEKLLVAVSPKPFVMVAVMAGVIPPLTQEGATHKARLLVAPLVRAPRLPALEDHEKASAEPSGSLATTSKVSCWDWFAVRLDW
jgi:hypothetical protein